MWSLTLNKDWTWMLVGMSVIAAYGAGKRLHYSVGVFTLIMLISSIMSDINPASAFTLLLFVGFFTCLSDAWSTYLKNILAALCGVSILSTLFQLGLPVHDRMGISGNASMNGCLIAVTLLPMLKVMRVQRLILTFMGVVAIYSVYASTPVGVLFVVIAASCLATQMFRKWIIPVGMALFGLGYALDSNSFFSSTGRFHAWATIWDWWVESGKIVFGVGMGAGNFIFDEASHLRMGFDSMYWAHNDYLQLLFDTGVVGLTSALLMLAYALKRSWARPWLFSAIVGYAATSFFNMPAHLPLHAFTGASLLWLAHNGDES